MQQTDRFKLFSEDEPRIGVIVCTGPSLTLEQLDKVKHLKRFGANRTFEFDLDVIAGCNWQFWHHYWDQIKDCRCHKWATLDYEKVNHFPGLNYIQAKFMNGLSRDKSYIAHHHSTGPQLLNIAYHYGCEVMLLLGWDMRYEGKVDRYTYDKRHYFGEDALTEKHWPINVAHDGTMDGFIKPVLTINPADYGIEIINCTPNSALTHFPMMDLDEALEKYAPTSRSQI